MKPAFKSAKQLGKKLSSVFLGCLLAAPFAAVAQPQGTYISPASVTTPPQVDATNFFNAGVWRISTTPFPYKTSHTLNYTNTGTMTGSVGWEFDYGPLFTGARGWSANFFNDSHATIAAVDGPIISALFTIENVGYLLISATNIVNRGTLTAGANGEIILNGSAVNLSRSQLEITPIAGIGSSNTKTNFLPDTAIYDQYWSGANSNVLSVGGSPWDGKTIVGAIFFNVGEPCGLTTDVVIGPFSNPIVADSFTNSAGPSLLILTNDMGGTSTVTVYSNEIRQAVFVFVNDTNITATNHFTPSLISTNPFNRVAVQLSTVSTNIITLTPQTTTIYLVDDLAASTNRTVLTNSFINPNAACGNPTERPSSVIVSRTDPGFVFASGAPGFGPPSGTFFYDPLTFSNRLATGIADVYSARVDNLAAEPPPGFSISNAPGKIFINAKDLDLSKTRISGASEVLIQASNLISSVGAAIDCQNLSYNFGSTNGLLNVVNLAGQNIQRLHGTINEWSGLWTNSIVTVFTNNFTFDTTTSNWISAPLTNVTEVDLAITVVDAGGLLTTIPVIVQDLILHSTNMTVSDSMTVANALLFDGQSLTIQGALSLTGPVQDWNSAIAPTLRFFTNNGVLQIPIDAHFGDDRVPNYAAFVNHGVISSGGQTINSDYLELNGGTNRVTAGNFMALCRTGLVMNTEIIAGGDIQFFANTLKIDPSILSAGGAINFTVTNSLSDAGFGSGNIFICQNGFNLVIKPATGDLLGTTVINTALGQDEVDNVWAGRDFGASAAGYSNNVAIGTLILNQASAVFEPLFRFTGANATNGLYVNHLDLSTLTDYANELQIDPNLTIYFISASLGTNVDITPSPSAEAFLDGQFGGHLRWVHGAAGPATTLSAASYNKNAGTFQFSIASQPGQTNVIQASTNLLNWIPIYTNVGSSLFVDPNATNYPHRFYRDLLLGP